METPKRPPRDHILTFVGDEEVDAECRHFDEGCGGCMLQSVPYERQVAAKEEMLSRAYGTSVRIVPASSPLGYRSRMDFVAAFGKKGLRKRKSFAQVVDVEECLLLTPRARDAYSIARERLAQVADYDFVRHEGFLRYVVVRASAITGEVMLVVTTRSPASKDEHDAFAKVLEGLFRDAQLASLHWRVNDGKADMSIGERYRHLGKEWIVDEIAFRQFRVYPETFFQANAAMASDLFLRAVRYAHGNVLDLYCGVGVISIIAAHQDGVDRVTGVEIVRESVEAAKENAILNAVSIDKCRFVCEDAAVHLRASVQRYDTVICDPARAGLEGAAALLLEHAPRRIVYVSCNPDTHRKDIEALKGRYDLALLEGYDLFPQTPHVEILSVLERRE